VEKAIEKNMENIIEKSKKKTSLRELKQNQSGMICRIGVSGEMGRRIRDMGLVPGTEIKVMGRAPLKDPVVLRLMGYTLTLRNSEADYIEVEALP